MVSKYILTAGEFIPVLILFFDLFAKIDIGFKPFYLENEQRRLILSYSGLIIHLFL